MLLDSVRGGIEAIRSGSPEKTLFLIEVSRSAACSAENVSVARDDSVEAKRSTLLARNVARSAPPSAARSAESAKLGNGVKLVSAFLSR
jgi:hypothetical protein